MAGKGLKNHVLLEMKGWGYGSDIPNETVTTEQLEKGKNVQEANTDLEKSFGSDNWEWWWSGLRLSCFKKKEEKKIWSTSYGIY